MPTTKCTYKNCDRSFTKDTQPMAEQALRMHIGRTHVKNIPTYKGGAKPASAPASNGNGNGKRKYTKRAQPITGTIAVNFCPQCGCSIHKVAIGMVLANQRA
jgi:hypothetical protein